MKFMKYLFTLVLLMLSLTIYSQELNRLEIEDMVGAAGKSVDVPIVLKNGKEIVAVQFDLHLPFAKASHRPVLKPERINGHTVSVRDLGNNAYTVVIVSLDNKPLKGNSGILLNFPMSVSASAQADEKYVVTITNPVLSLSDGKNVASESVPGNFSIQRVPTPDLTIENIKATEESLFPGQEINVSWTVKNVGKEVTGAGWQEKIFLVDKKGHSYYIGDTYSDAKLAQGVSLPRFASLKLPKNVGCDGKVAVRIELLPRPNTGELKSDQGNNKGQSEQLLYLEKRLDLTVEGSRIQEGNTMPVRFQLSRSGYWDIAETFQIAAKTAGRLNLPKSVTIPKGQSGAYFYVTAVDNDFSNEYFNEIVTVKGSNGYGDVSHTIDIEDDELLTLRLAADKDELTEGEEFALTITRQHAQKADTVLLTCEKPTRFVFPSQVIMAAGETSKQVQVKALDDNLADVDHSVGFYAVAPHYLKAEQLIILKDNDIPDITMELAPSTVSEGAGLSAVMATLRRTSATNSRITIKLTDNSEGVLYTSTRTIVMEKGVTEAQFTLGVVDNAEVEGQRVYDLVAAVHISSCDCSGTATDKGIVKKQITVLDDDGPALSMATSSSMVQEGGTAGTMLTVRHNLPTTREVVVRLSSEDSFVDIPAQVVIPIGQKEIKVPVKARANETEGDTRTVVLKAESDGFADGSCWLLISDNTLPDAYIANLEVETLVPRAESELEATLKLGNAGVRPLPSGTEIVYCLSGVSEPLATFTLPVEVGPESVTELKHQLRLTGVVGKHNLTVQINPSRKVTECLYVNNSSDPLNLNIRAPYVATAVVDNDIIEPAAPVVVYGQITGDKVANMPVEVYVINEGVRKVFETETDNTGKYRVGWNLSADQIGRFVVGACYPGENLNRKMDEFNVYGLRRVNANYIKCETLVGTDFHNAFVLENPSQLDLHNLRVEVIEGPKACEMEFATLSKLAGGEKLALAYCLKGTAATEGRDWEHVKIRVISDEGATLNMVMYYYCRTPKGKLYTATNRIETTMIKGDSRDFIMEISNVGQGPTGEITLALPENQKWMTAVTPMKMASLQPNERATVILRLIPTEEMQLNVPVTGRIGINCENGEGLPLSFRIETVSEKSGTLFVDVCDESTYYTEAAPHLANAQIVIKHPVTGALITQGKSDNKGHFSVDLPEGYYTLNVTADDHDSYTGTVLVDPGKTNSHLVNLSIQAIKVDWNVVETEVEDVYDIVTTVKYETEVPVPVIEVILPDSLPMQEIKQQGSCLINAILTNRGLIEAKLVNLNIKEAKGFEFEYLVENGFSMMPKQSVMVPVRVKMVPQTASNENLVSTKANQGVLACMLDVLVDWMWYCGPDRKHATSHYAMKAAKCMGFIPGGASFGPCGPDAPGGGSESGGYGGSSSGGTVNASDVDCDPCLYGKMKEITKCILKKIPIFGLVLDIEEIVVCEDKYCFFTKLIKKEHFISKIVGFYEDYQCVKKLFEECEPSKPDGKRNMVKALTPAESNPYGENLPSYMVHYLNTLQKCDNVINAEMGIILELMGDTCWVTNLSNESERAIFMDAFTTWMDNGMLDDASVLAAKPSTITDAQLTALLQRWKNSVDENPTDENSIHQDRLHQYAETLRTLNDEAKAAGFVSPVQWFNSEQETFDKEAKGNSGSVCSTVTLQINQTMTMTRQAFLGTLTVYNGHETKAMEQVKLTLEVTDENGDLATSHEFQITPKELKGFEGPLNLTDGWTLHGRETGVATIQFIPTRYAAPTEPVDYSFGGTLSYVNPYTGETIVRTLYPVRLTVKPSPVLDLTYFMQRDIMGDNALTPDVVEPMVPSEFSLLINNRGYGDATNVNISTQQPKIIENEKGLLIDFEILSSQVNGKQKNLALGGSVGADFGTIPAHSTAYAQWMLQSSLMGHFIEYDVKATHVTSYGNKDLSLLNDVSIHELIHSVRVPKEEQDTLMGFLVNDIEDALDSPDALYLSDGNVYNVVSLDPSTLSWKSTGTQKTHVLNVLPEQSAWHYGHIADPTLGKSKLQKVTRMSDNTEIPLQNFWQTEYTLKDGKEPLQEYLIHFVDSLSLSAEGTDYKLEFMPYPEVLLAVEAFDSLDTENDLHVKPVEQVHFRFNKPIDPSTFGLDDLNMICQAKPVDLSKVTLTSDDQRNYTIHLGQTAVKDGFYVLTVKTDSIRDLEGFYGKMSKSCDWIYFLDGLLNVRAEAYPKEGGNVSIIDLSAAVSTLAKKSVAASSEDEQKVKYNHQFGLHAQAAPGYRFDGWYLNDAKISSDPDFQTSCLDHTLLKAMFLNETRSVVVVYNADHGIVIGAGTGEYGYGETLTFQAVPKDGFALAGWLINGKLCPVSADNIYKVVLTQDLEIQPVFTVLISGGSVGDVNGDGLITITDVTMLQDYVLDKPVQGFNKDNADVNGDGLITIVDCSVMINQILNNK